MKKLGIWLEGKKKIQLHKEKLDAQYKYFKKGV